ncbi:hypothetical protein CORC01_08246 [Colletotrichum orchidophilum]|uniref:Nephrocystin 3-like N-terminal domain-containing protein n=1 Tax=Colletotrichum orchidophilum TaxID=1209926 RepID=A0A1G4B591_9PEZI|nr:uncharacterized protein CORC01_08246 [Colletotrichum orchidophilum]OHE96483.1 hypothetical protein CORC01_08246 [Colletotrichum orchidophilum]
MAGPKSSEDAKSGRVSALIARVKLGLMNKTPVSAGPSSNPAVSNKPNPEAQAKSAENALSNGVAGTTSSERAGNGTADVGSKPTQPSTEAHGDDAASLNAQLPKHQPINIAENKPTDLWSEALEKTLPDTKSWFGKLDIDRSSTIQVKEFTTIVRQSEAAYKDASARLEIDGHKILWRDYANRVVTWVTTIGDIAVPLAPAPASPVWSALKVLLKAETGRVEQITAVFGAADRILSTVRRGQIYEAVYGLSSATLIEPSRVLLRESLIELYRSSLDLLALTFNKLGGEDSWVNQFLTALIDPNRAELFLSDLTNTENEASKNAGACVCESTERNLELLQSLHSPLRRIDDRVAQLLDDFKDKERRDREEAMNRISDVKVDQIHVAKKELRTNGTCEWLLQHPRFLAWEGSSCSSILWLNGQMGAGKSFLVSKVIDRYRTRPRDALGNGEGFAHFYCDRSQSGQRDIQSILSSYIVQLFTVSRHRDIWHTKLREFFLDALDECEQKSRARVISFFRNLVENSDRPVKVFVSSRPETDITELMGTSSFIQISTTDNQKDIEKYIDSKLRQDGLNPVWKRQSVQSLVRNALLEKHGGMFKWVQLQWDQLEPLNTVADVKQRLEQLPKGLVASYEEIYSRQDDHALMILMRVSMWVKWARSPLDTASLLHAVRLSFSQTGDQFNLALDEETTSEAELANICRHLIIKEDGFNNERWKFPHASIAEYFDAKLNTWTHNAERDVATLLLLQASLTTDQAADQNEGDNAPHMVVDGASDIDFCQYATRNWLNYVRNIYRKCPDTKEISDVLRYCLSLGDTVDPSGFQHQTSLTDKETPRRLLSSSYHGGMFSHSNPIFAICVLGSFDLLEYLHLIGVDLNQTTKDGDSLLSVAAKSGHHKLCEFLIDHGVEVNDLNETSGWSPLHHACQFGHSTIVKLLLEKNADPNSSIYHTPLCVAAPRQSSDIVLLLLKWKADPNIPCQAGGAMCCAESAFSVDADETFKQLLKHGANVELLTDNNVTALGKAVRDGAVKCTRVFIEERGYDVNSSVGKFYGSTLGAALFCRSRLQRRMLDYLIKEAKVDPNVLISSPPKRRKVDSFTEQMRRRKLSQYLVEETNLTLKDLRHIGFYF